MGRPMARPTIRDVARHANVSLGTVSRVLNGHANVDAVLRGNVERAIVDLNYSPDTVARSMRNGATQMIGVMVRDIVIPSLAGFVRAIQDELFGAGYVPLIACSDNHKEREIALLELFARRRMQGVIMLSASDLDPELVAARSSLASALVLFDRKNPEDRDAVLVEHAAGMRETVEYLLGMGHRRIGMLTGPLEISPTGERIAGYEEAHLTFGIEPALDLVMPIGFEDDSSRGAVAHLLSLPEPPTAIITGGIQMLPGAMTAVREKGLSIPGDVSLIGSIDSDLAKLAVPPVTVIHWDYEAIGRTAARLVLQRIAEPDRPPQRVRFPTRLIKRGTTAPPKTP